jgi:hypothetical protein
VTPEFRARSFDQPRERVVPEHLAGVDLRGEAMSHLVSGPTLVVAVKHSCDGCREFVFSALPELANVTVVVVSATDDPSGEWAGAGQQIMVAPELLRQLDVRSPPFYVLVDVPGPRVVSEGVVFAPSQVAEEIAPYLT